MGNKLISTNELKGASQVALVVKSQPDNTEDIKRHRFDPWVGETSWRRAWQPTPVFLPGKSHGQWSLAGYSPWGHKRVIYDWVTKQQSLIKVNAKFFNETLANRIQQYIKSIIQHEQVRFIPGIQGWFDIYKSMQHITLMKWRLKII